MDKATLRAGALELLMLQLLPTIDRIVLETAAVNIRVGIHGASPEEQRTRLYAVSLIEEAVAGERTTNRKLVLLDGGRED